MIGVKRRMCHEKPNQNVHEVQMGVPLHSDTNSDGSDIHKGGGDGSNN